MKIKSISLSINCCIKRYIIGENLRFFGISKSPSGAKSTIGVMYNFLEEELNLENAENIEFQSAHQIGF